MFTEGKITKILYLADEFCKFFDAEQEQSMLSAPQDGKKHCCKPNRMSDAEIIVIPLPIRICNADVLSVSIYNAITYTNPIEPA